MIEAQLSRKMTKTVESERVSKRSRRGLQRRGRWNKNRRVLVQQALNEMLSESIPEEEGFYRYFKFHFFYTFHGGRWSTGLWSTTTEQKEDPIARSYSSAQRRFETPGVAETSAASITRCLIWPLIVPPLVVTQWRSCLETSWGVEAAAGVSDRYPD